MIDVGEPYFEDMYSIEYSEQKAKLQCLCGITHEIHCEESVPCECGRIYWLHTSVKVDWNCQPQTEINYGDQDNEEFLDG